MNGVLGGTQIPYSPLQIGCMCSHWWSLPTRSRVLDALGNGVRGQRPHSPALSHNAHTLFFLTPVPDLLLLLQQSLPHSPLSAKKEKRKKREISLNVKQHTKSVKSKALGY